ncbi:MAG TPA: pyridoxamine 5'-phosphate oxidase family protein [Myxococcota bacterium]|jgi:general stress protein 26|nr:pyridoxamine 5'-phosphate oxidase family protein [Myxococcota bacterium]
MARVSAAEKADFFEAVDEASRKATWCALATVENGAPRVRLVHPTWEGDVLWFATSPSSAKARQLRAHPEVDVQYQVSPPDFVHVLVRGRAEILADDPTRRHVWDVLDYDLTPFWPGGPTDPSYVAVRIVPERVELSRMFGSQAKRVWRR